MRHGTRLAAALVGYHNGVEPWMRAGLRMPAGVGVAAASVGLARRRGLSWEELGLSGRQVRTGLVWSLALAGAAATATVVLLSIPRTRALFRDDRVDPRRLPLDALLRMPVGTALVEETAFRGALYGLLADEVGPRAALVGSSVAFGLWHVAPALAQLAANRPEASPRERARTVALQVATTGAGGLALGWLRRRTGGILAPALVHWAANVLGALGAVAAR